MGLTTCSTYGGCRFCFLEFIWYDGHMVHASGQKFTDLEMIAIRPGA